MNAEAFLRIGGEGAHAIDRQGLALNDRNRIEISFEDIGGTQLLVIDHLYRSPDYVRSLALSLDYDRQAGIYPGRLALISVRQQPLLALINECLQSTGRQLESHPQYRELTFAMVTKRAGELIRAQQTPHYDSFCDMAGVVYLNPHQQCSGGTSFWRHRSTGLAMAPPRELRDLSIRPGSPSGNPERRRILLDDGINEMPHGFLTASIGNWELSRTVDMKFNRLILYNARLFHSLHIPNNAFGDTNETRRLTQNLYFNYER